MFFNNKIHVCKWFVYISVKKTLAWPFKFCAFESLAAEKVSLPLNKSEISKTKTHKSSRTQSTTQVGNKFH